MLRALPSSLRSASGCTEPSSFTRASTFFSSALSRDGFGGWRTCQTSRGKKP
jgi:hypothetical protein